MRIHKRLIPLLMASVVLLFSAACLTGAPEEISEEDIDIEATDVPEMTDEPILATSEAPAYGTPLPACAAVLGEMVNEAEDPYAAEDPDLYEGDGNSYVLVTYQVENGELSSAEWGEVPDELLEAQENTERHNELWEFISAFVPPEQVALISEFILFSDGADNDLGAVDLLNEDPEAWSLEVDITDAEDREELIATLVHEFGHLVTLNSSQFPRDEPATCPYYQSDETCMNADSYLNLFYQQFWTGIVDEWEIASGEDALTEFYEQYSDQFVSEYATTDPDEDIVESWMFFILAPAPEGNSIAEEKILFFYDFLDLVNMRNYMTNALCRELGY